MFSVRIFGFAGFLAVVASPVSALSCLPYSPQQAFTEAERASDRYVVARGQIDFNPADLPKVDMQQQDRVRPDNFLAAGFTGFSLTGRGFTARFVRQIRVNVKCLGPWCGSLVPGQDYLAFIRKDRGGYLLEVGPCYGKAFADPDEALLADMRACLLGEPCEGPARP